MGYQVDYYDQLAAVVTISVFLEAKIQQRPD